MSILEGPQLSATSLLSIILLVELWVVFWPVLSIFKIALKNEDLKDLGGSSSPLIGLGDSVIFVDTVVNIVLGGHHPPLTTGQ